MIDRLCIRIAYLLPRRVVYHAYIRLHGYATSQAPHATRHPDECSWAEALTAWSKTST